MQAAVAVRCASPEDLGALWEAAYLHLDWTEFNGPYFPFEVPALEKFADEGFPPFLEGRMRRVVEFDGEIIGWVTAYWECEATRWLQVGIVLFDSKHWGKGFGTQALSRWITYQFGQHELEHIGLTTWSGNDGMMGLAHSLGLKLEGCLRKCRYYNGVYYDSVMFGVLREEWFGGGMDGVSAGSIPAI